VYCSIGVDAGSGGSQFDNGDGTTEIYNGNGDIDALWDGSGGCYLHIREFNCTAATAHPIITCRG